MSCSLTTVTELAACASAQEASVLAMTTLSAPPPPPVDASRAPLEIVAVVDRSGSMSGQKVMLLKQTLELLVKRGGLQPTDRLGIVTFDHNVDVALPLTQMDASGRHTAAQVAASICVGGTTNLSGGLLAGLKMLCMSDEASREAADDAVDGEAAVCVSATRSVLLFTDGHANAGITDGASMVEAAQAVTKDHPGISIFTFGYGADHNESTLRSLAEGSGGLCYFVEQPDQIPTAFADCLGGLVSVVCQNATLELKAVGGRHATARIERVLCGTTYPVATRADGVTVVQLGDLYADDEKDVLFKVQLAVLPAPKAEPHPVIESTLKYYAVAAKRFEEVSAQLLLARPEQPPPDAAVHLGLDEQRNRLEVAEAIEQASALADRGERAAGKALLHAAAAKVGTSPSSRAPLSRALQADLQRLALDYEDECSYQSSGSKRSKASALSHRQQRDAASAPGGSGDFGYKAGKAGKGSMARAWSRS